MPLQDIVPQGRIGSWKLAFQQDLTGAVSTACSDFEPNLQDITPRNQLIPVSGRGIILAAVGDEAGTGTDVAQFRISMIHKLSAPQGYGDPNDPAYNEPGAYTGLAFRLLDATAGYPTGTSTPSDMDDTILATKVWADEFTSVTLAGGIADWYTAVDAATPSAIQLVTPENGLTIGALVIPDVLGAEALDIALVASNWDSINFAYREIY